MTQKNIFEGKHKYKSKILNNTGSCLAEYQRTNHDDDRMAYNCKFRLFITQLVCWPVRGPCSRHFKEVLKFVLVKMFV